MSSTTRSPSARYEEYRETQHVRGWLAFAGFMITIIGIMNVVYGIAAIDDANFYVANAKYVVADLNTWGWIMLLVGILQIGAAVSIWNRSEWGRWVGIFSAGCNSIVMLMFLPAYPLLALSFFAVDILIIYGLFAYGGRPDES